MYFADDDKIAAVAKSKEVAVLAKTKKHSIPAKIRRSYFMGMMRFAKPELLGVSNMLVNLATKSVIYGLMEKMFVNKKMELRKRKSRVIKGISLPFLEKIL